jgi:hypothetical protein
MAMVMLTMCSCGLAMYAFLSTDGCIYYVCMDCDRRNP